MISLLRDLLAHQAWADAVFFRAWCASEAPGDEELRRRVAHLVEVQEAFLTVLKGETPAQGEGPLPDRDALKGRCRAAHEVYSALARTLDGVALHREVRIPWFPDPPCVVPVADALLQVCLHTQHHRAQCMTRLKALGGTPRTVDYIVWKWKQKPEPRWE